MLVYQVLPSAVVPFFFLFGFLCISCAHLRIYTVARSALGFFSPTFFMFGLAAATATDPTVYSLSICLSRGRGARPSL